MDMNIDLRKVKVRTHQILYIWCYRCNMTALFAEIDRLLRPEGIIIIRDNIEIMNELEVEKAFRSMHWEVRLTYSKDAQGLLCMKKTTWRPKHLQTLAYAIA